MVVMMMMAFSFENKGLVKSRMERDVDMSCFIGTKLLDICTGVCRIREAGVMYSLPEGKIPTALCMGLEFLFPSSHPSRT